MSVRKTGETEAELGEEKKFTKRYYERREQDLFQVRLDVPHTLFQSNLLEPALPKEICSEVSLCV